MTETIVEGKTYSIVREGLAEILNPKQPDDQAGGPNKRAKVQDVFYNPIQQFNRDLSVLAIRAFAEDLTVIREMKRKRKKPNGGLDGPRGGKKRKRALEDDGNRAPDGLAGESGGAAAEAVSGNGIDATSETAKEETALPPADDGPNEPRNESSTSDPTPRETAASAKFPFRILDALSATGLRAVRYAKEIPATTSVTANDLSAHAAASIKLNVLHNEIPHQVNVLTGDARAHMYRVGASKPGEQSHYEVIDLDPYGTATPFLDAAVGALVDGGLLCVTCTDAGVFASTGYLEKTFSQYGGLPMKGPHSHEGGLRLVLHAIAVCAARYGLAIEPLLSLSIDFYVRVFVRIYRSPAQVKFLASKTMAVYNCDSGCGAWNTQFFAQIRELEGKNGGPSFHKFSLAQAPSTSQSCEHCGFKTHLSGPMWGGPLHNPYFIRRILDAIPSLDEETYGTIPRIEGMLSVAYQETLFAAGPEKTSDSDEITRPVPPMDPTLRDQHPFFLIPSALAGTLHCVGPSDALFCGSLKRLGYRTSRSHTKAGSIRTDAPWSVIWEVMREWIRQKAPIKENAIREGTPGWGIMQKDRSKSKLNSMKLDLKQVLDKSENLDGMRTQLEAMLYRLRKEKEGEPMTPTTTTTDTTVADGCAQAPIAELQPSDSTKPSSRAPVEKVPPAPHELDIVFETNRRARTPSPPRKIVRYQMNPRPDWGPISRAKR
jgi:tRNA (guanine26-N2/guanine27-N2)-dimethyltransferase